MGSASSSATVPSVVGCVVVVGSAGESDSGFMASMVVGADGDVIEPVVLGSAKGGLSSVQSKGSKMKK